MTNAAYRKCKMERLLNRRNRHLVNLVFKHAEDPDNRVLQNNRTRSDKKVKLKVERPKREKYRRGPLYRGMQLWDELPPDVQKSDSLQLFKTGLAKCKL